ncbi:MAG: NAD(P)/FAD-dependent oxidoreductase [Firmicutes bacterium]|nr:NAD(P)/FAD-dependent oxidoreductase [Bacillota bacterium]
MNYLILGSGIAAMAAAEAIRNSDKTGRIRMISAEQELCFNRPMLIGEFALDGSGAALFEKQQDWPRQFDVEVRLGCRAVSIDRDAKAVHLEDGSVETYDKLIYALGAQVTVPPIPGADRESVLVVRTREDMEKIRARMRQAKQAVVIGGGMLGLEDAWALHEQKLDVAIIEQKQRVAFGQIDQSAGNLMKKRIERMGVPVYLNASVTEIGDGYVSFRQEIPGAAAENPPEIELVTIPADLVILSTGVTPNCALGAQAGLAVTGRSTGEKTASGSTETGEDFVCGGCGACCGGLQTGACWIAVDEYCRTSDPDIFAAGDCAAVNGRNDAIWDEAREMGRVAGSNAAAGSPRAADTNVPREVVQTYYPEEPEVYVPVTAQHIFTGFDTEVFTMADSSGAGTDGVYIRHADVEIFDYQRERYIRVSLQDGIIAGILLINASELAPELMDAYRRGDGEEEARQIIQRWKDSHDVDFKPAAPFQHR